LATAKSLHREIEFLLAWPPHRAASVDPKASPQLRHELGAHFVRPQPPNAQPNRYITGKIDCLYEDADGVWRIIDYKTNEATSKDIDGLVDQYEMQLYVYAMAVEQSLGVAPTELVLQLLSPGVEHVIPWNDDARKRAIELVSEAIEGTIGATIEAVMSAPEPAHNPRLVQQKLWG
jgi:ATP-dependent exoDNAse (exonuclease V) beta subunit